MYEAECIVVGAGVVGLAIARELALAGRDVIVLEAEAQKGLHASSRNTGVIHAGINYPPDSLKGRLCLDGKNRLYAYCAEKGVPHARIGKLVTADPDAGDDGVAYLKRLLASANARGLAELAFLTEAEAKRMEPALRCSAALWSPTSGIIDVHGYMDALQGDLEDRGGRIAFRSPVRSGKVAGDRIELVVGDAAGTRISCRVLVNAAGLNAPDVAAAVTGLPRRAIPPRLLSRGSYCVLAGASPFSHLVYPAPHGVHASLDLGGQLRFGPDAEWTETIDYRFDESRIAPFYAKVRTFYPDLRDGDLAPGWVGIRAKISTGKTNEVDFRIERIDAGACCAVDLYGIDSPGLTASLAVAAEVHRLVDKNEGYARASGGDIG